MKINKSILATALGLSLVGASEAGTVYLTGSTAFRSQTYNALITPGSVFTAAPTLTTYDGSAPNKANYMAFSGTLVGGGATTVQCHWSGSEAGFIDTASNPQVPQTFAATLDGANHTGVPTSFVSHNVDLNLADNVQDYSGIFANNVNPPPVLATGKEVGVITFEYVRNPGNWTGSNITHSMIRQALGGFCRRSVFTGVAGQTDYVYVSGRDSGSGTRVNTFGENGFGIFNGPQQVKINSSGIMQDLDGFGTYEGDFGYSSGGTLAGTMGGNTVGKEDKANGAPGNTDGFSVVSYMSTSDAATAITAGATPLAYDGVPFTPANVKEGTYTFWNNEYLYQANSAGSEAQAVYARLIGPSGIEATLDGTTGIKLGDMHCTKSNPVADPVHP
jgi:hypothetical protein